MCLIPGSNYDPGISIPMPCMHRTEYRDGAVFALWAKQILQTT